MVIIACYYATLGVTPRADAEEIKRAYRRAALEWHPDKNQHRIEEATENFKLISAAHEILSDSNERAWYDAHRDDILGNRNESSSAGATPGGSASSGGGLLNVFVYFTASAYTGFDDSPAGFYAIFRGVFATVAAEEQRFASSDAPSPPSASFGGADAASAAVSKFYVEWGDFSSRMTFSWADVRNPNEAANRVERRFIERENEAARRNARRERNEQIRALVAFVRKRDKRLISMALEARSSAAAAAADRAAQDAAAASAIKATREAARAAAAQARRELDDEFASAFRFANEDGLGGGVARHREAPGVTAVADPTGDEAEATSTFDCAACEKAFKSSAAYENHTRSKKHAEAVSHLARVMAESRGDGLVETAEEEDGGGEESSGSSQSSAPEPIAQNEGDNLGDDNASPQIDAIATSLASTFIGGGAARHRRDGDSDSSSGPRKRRPNKTELRRAARASAQSQGAVALKIEAELDPDKALRRLDPSKIRGGAKGAPLAAFIATHDGLSLRRGAEARMDDIIGSYVCETCGDVAPTRNALFLHLKRSGHAAPAGVAEPVGRGKAKRRSKKVTAESDE